MIEIPLTRGFIAVVDDCDGDLALHKWTSKPNGSGLAYAYRHETKHSSYIKSLMLHRVIAERIVGRALEAGETVDHIDCNPLNNTRANLRVCSHSDNYKNRRKYRTNKSGFKGVSWDKYAKKWRAQICVNGKVIRLGAFDSPEDGAKAYNQAALRYFGEFARLNEV